MAVAQGVCATAILAVPAFGTGSEKQTASRPTLPGVVTAAVRVPCAVATVAPLPTLAALEVPALLALHLLQAAETALADPALDAPALLALHPLLHAAETALTHAAEAHAAKIAHAALTDPALEVSALLALHPLHAAETALTHAAEAHAAKIAHATLTDPALEVSALLARPLLHAAETAHADPALEVSALLARHLLLHPHQLLKLLQQLLFLGDDLLLVEAHAPLLTEAGDALRLAAFVVPGLASLSRIGRCIGGTDEETDQDPQQR